MKQFFRHYFTCMLMLTSTLNVNAQDDNKPVCTGGSYDLVKPYLGTWSEYRVTDSTEVYTGTLITRLEVRGCAITQHYMERDSSFTYTSFGFVNPNSGLWEETYVFSTGSTSVYQWVMEKGELATKRIHGSRNVDHIYRLRYVDTTDREYTVIGQRSYDGGKTWQSESRTRIERTG